MWIKVKYAVNVVVISQRLKFSLRTTMMNRKRQGIHTYFKNKAFRLIVLRFSTGGRW
jgi:hypothetical protein